MLGNFQQSVVCVAALAFAVVAAAAEQRPAIEPVPVDGVLLLKNGEVLEGKISRAGEHYYVAVRNGELRIRAESVEFSCRSLEEGYRQKRSAIRTGNADDHLRLAVWCEHHGLLGHAARELANAIDADPAHPAIGTLERRIRLAMEPPKPALPSQPPAEPPPDWKEFDRLIGEMPSGSVETFTQTVQPLLVNHCTSAGCHGPGTETKFRLLRAPAGRSPRRRLTQRNLHATLQWIDRGDPKASPLLTAPVNPHGTAKVPVFTNSQVAQYQRLVDWVFQVAEKKKAEVPETVSANHQPLVRAMPAETSGFDFPPPQQQPPQQPQPQRNDATPGHADPFDPEIFNRRYHGNSG